MNVVGTGCEMIGRLCDFMSPDRDLRMTIVEKSKKHRREDVL